MNPLRYLYKYADGPANIVLYLYEYELMNYVRKGIKLTRVS